MFAAMRRLSWLACVVLMLPALAHAQSKEQCVAAYEDAQLRRLHGQYVAAREALLVCVQPACPNLLRGDCLNWLPEVERSVPSLVFAVTDLRGNDVPDARVFANGKLLEGWQSGRAVPLDPGVYTLRFEAPGREFLEQSVTVREAEKNRLVRARLSSEDEGVEPGAPVAGVTSDPLMNEHERASTVPLAAYFLGGTSLVSLGAFTYFAVSGKKEYDRLEKECKPNCRESETKEGRRNYVLADVTLGVAVVSGAAALWIWLAERRRDRTPAGDLTLDVSRERAQLGWQQRF
jgi:hypothetical protein